MKKTNLQIISKQKIILLSITIILFVITGFFYRERAFSIHFVDEDDNIVLGKYLTNGDKIYQDLFSHHQPLAYIFSAGIQKTTNPDTLYLLISRHREAIILWGLLWSVLLVFRFGIPVLLTIISYELTKIYLFGNLFLSESLVVYPLLYLLGSIFFTTKITRIVELFFIGVCFGLGIFLLAPLWPGLIFLGLLILSKITYQKIILLILGFTLVSCIVLPFITISGYLHDAFYINFNYYIPAVSNASWLQNFFQSLVSPIISLISGFTGNGILIIMQIFSAVFLINLLFFFKKNILLTIFILVSLTLTNIRFVTPGLQYYSGFHILPWFISLIFFTFYLISRNSYFYRNWKLQVFFLVLLLSCLLTSVLEAKTSLLTMIDKDRDYYVNYSQIFDSGIAVRIMKQNQDTIFVVPDQWLVYWQGDGNHATKMLNYYAWMTEVPELNTIVEDNFKQNPPTFFYCDCNGAYFGLEKYWNLYQPLIKDNEKTKLLVLKTKLKTLSKEQLDKLSYYNFTIDELN